MYLLVDHNRVPGHIVEIIGFVMLAFRSVHTRKATFIILFLYF